MTKRIPPTIENAPGHVCRPLINGRWLIKWQARTDLKRRGYQPRDARLWIGTEAELTEDVVKEIQNKCSERQVEMLIWGRGGIPVVGGYNGSLRSLMQCYRTDPDSPYHKGRFPTRQNYDSLMRSLEGSIIKGDLPDMIVDLKARGVLRWHETKADKIVMAHSCVTMLRILVGFGATFLEDPECLRLSAVLHKMKFKNAKPRNERLTAEQVIAIRAMAHAERKPSIALAQAFQFEGILRQKDVIGELVPISESGFSTVIFGNEKWMRGIVWSEIDADFRLKHITSKRQKEIDIDLKNAPMVLEELRLLAGIGPDAPLTRDLFPSSGPLIISETTAQPYVNSQFRRAWRALATKCGVPKNVKNMDTRAGAISEATDAGADLHHVQHAATHSDISMTQRYSRGATEKIAGVQLTRVAHRNKSGTN